MKVATTRMMTNGELLPKALAIICPISFDAPDAPRTLLRVMPPPKRRSTPQSVLSVTSFQLASPRTTTAIIAQRATKVSGLSMPSSVFSGSLKIHASAVSTKTAKVKTRNPVQGISSAFSCRIFCLKLGLQTK